jgi:hypothetical protein
MPSLSPKDRVSLCLFNYEDGRRCRTPRISSHPHFCFYHAQKESQSQAAEKLAKDLAYFFSGDYLSANDLNAALGRLIPAVIRGEIKPRVARTVAYMLQTLMQSTRLAQHEYINASSTDGWRDAISTPVTANRKYLHPPKPKLPTQSPARPAPTTQTPPPPPQQSVAATPSTPPPPRPSPADTEAALAAARAIFPDRSTAPVSSACHPERSEGPRLDSAPSTTGETELPINPAPPAQSPTNPASPHTAQPNNTPAEAALSGTPRISRRRPHNAPTNSFATNIYTRPGNY